MSDIFCFCVVGGDGIVGAVTAGDAVLVADADVVVGAVDGGGGSANVGIFDCGCCAEQQSYVHLAEPESQICFNGSARTRLRAVVFTILFALWSFFKLTTSPSGVLSNTLCGTRVPSPWKILPNPS